MYMRTVAALAMLIAREASAEAQLPQLVQHVNPGESRTDDNGIEMRVFRWV